MKHDEQSFLHCFLASFLPALLPSFLLSFLIGVLPRKEAISFCLMLVEVSFDAYKVLFSPYALSGWRQLGSGIYQTTHPDTHEPSGEPSPDQLLKRSAD